MPVRDLLSAASTQGASPADPYFYDVSLLLNGDGTNGAQNNTFLDSSTNNFTITRNGNTTQGSFSPYGNLWSNYFTTNNYLTAPANAAFQMGSGDFTIEAWIFPTATAGSSGSEIISYGASGQFDGWHFYQVASTNVLSFGLNYAGLIVSSSAALALNTWTHVAVTRSGTTFKLWINGVNDGTATSSTSQSTNGSDLLYVGTGSYSQGADRSFIGYISNARVVKGSVVYSTTFTPSTTPLTAITNTALLTCQSNRFRDNSSNAFALTINGSPSVQRFSPFNPTAPYSTSVIGGSGYFDGSGDGLRVASSAALAFGTGDFSVECWVNWRTVPSHADTIINVNVSGGFSFYWDGGTYTANRLVVSDRNANQFIEPFTPIANAWYHFVVSRVSNNFRVWVNGTQLGSTATVTTNYAQGEFQIGSSSDGASWAIDAYISDIRIVKGSGVTSVTVPTAPLTAITNTSLLTNFTNAGIPDLAMMNNLETVGNAQVSTSVKKYGTGSLYFDGNGDYLVAPPSPVASLGNGDFTVEFWLYATSPAANQRLVQSTNGGFGSTDWIIRLQDAARIQVALAYPDVLLASSTQLSSNTWYYITLTRSGSSVKLWINGTNEATGTSSSNLSSSVFYVGGYYTSGNTEYFTGYIDDLRITKGLARYTANFTPPTAALPTY